jgi:hypothetical protein
MKTCLMTNPLTSDRGAPGAGGRGFRSKACGPASRRSNGQIEDREIDPIFSAASRWEIAIKHQPGRTDFAD